MASEQQRFWTVFDFFFSDICFCPFYTPSFFFLKCASNKISRKWMAKHATMADEIKKQSARTNERWIQETTDIQKIPLMLAGIIPLAIYCHKQYMPRKMILCMSRAADGRRRDEIKMIETRDYTNQHDLQYDWDHNNTTVGIVFSFVKRQGLRFFVLPSTFTSNDFTSNVERSGVVKQWILEPSKVITPQKTP